MSKDNSNQYPLNLGYSQDFEDQGSSNQSQYNQCSSNQSQYDSAYSQPQYSNNQQSEPEKNGQSALAITGFVLSLIGCTYIAGIILGIIDLVRTKGKKNGLAIAAVAIGGAWVLISCLVFVIAYAGNKTIEENKQVTSYNSNYSDASTDSSNDEVADVDSTDSGDTGVENTDSIVSETTAEEDESAETNSGVYHVGDVISVQTDSGEYTITFTSVAETSERNMFSDKDPERVILIDFKVENIDYEYTLGDYKNNEVSVYSTNFNAYDADGEALDTYPLTVKYATSITPGHKASGQLAYCLDNDTNFIELEYVDNPLMSADITINLEW